MKRFLLSVQLMLALLCAASCSYKSEDRAVKPAVDVQAAEAAIRHASDDWGKAMTARDVEKTISFYSGDSLYLANHHPLINSKDGLREYWKQLFAIPGPGFTCDTTRVEVAQSGDLAYEAGTCEFKKTDAHGKPSTEKQKYLVVWKKQADTSWKAVIDIDNTD